MNRNRKYCNRFGYYYCGNPINRMYNTYLQLYTMGCNLNNLSRLYNIKRITNGICGFKSCFW